MGSLKKKLAHLGVRVRERDATHYANIDTCPVCTRDIPYEKRTIRELIHMRKHLGHPNVTDKEWQDIEASKIAWQIRRGMRTMFG